MEILAYVVIGIVLGLIAGWLIRGARQGSASPGVERELREQLRTREAELAAAREAQRGLVAAEAAAKAAQIAAVEALQDSRQAGQQQAGAAEAMRARLELGATELRERNAHLAGEVAKAQAELSATRELGTSLQAMLVDERKRHETAATTAAARVSAQQDEIQTLKQREAEKDERIRFLNERIAVERQQIESIQARFTKDFEAVSNKLLVDSSAKFNQQSTESLGQLLAPLKENLVQFKTSLETTRQEAATHSALLKEQVGKIGSEAANLVRALKGDSKVLGSWGENMLDQLLEKSGLQRDVHYRRQHVGKDVEGDRRFLDVVIDLPENRHLVIDSKVSLRHYEESVNCADETARLELITRHVELTRKHFRELGEKRYHETHGIHAPDFVLMYVPIEAAYFSAIAREPALFAEALERGVVLITNSTLLATLRTVSHVWRLADQQKNAMEIAERGGRLYDKFVGFVEDLNKVGEALASGQASWEAATNKLHTGVGNLVRQAEQLKLLGVKAAKALPASAVTRAAAEAEELPGLAAPPPENAQR